MLLLHATTEQGKARTPKHQQPLGRCCSSGWVPTCRRAEQSPAPRSCGRPRTGMPVVVLPKSYWSSRGRRLCSPNPMLLSLDVTAVTSGGGQSRKTQVAFPAYLGRRDGDRWHCRGHCDTGRARDSQRAVGAELLEEEHLTFLQDLMHPCVAKLPPYCPSAEPQECATQPSRHPGISLVIYCNDFLVSKSLLSAYYISCCFLGSFVQKRVLFSALHHVYLV